jgi:hypothetical protein
MSQGFVIYHKNNPSIILKWYKTMRGAKIGRAAMDRNAGTKVHVVIAQEAHDLFHNHIVVVKSLMTGQDVEIRSVDKGGPCDPSMERFWSM